MTMFFFGDLINGKRQRKHDGRCISAGGSFHRRNWSVHPPPPEFDPKPGYPEARSVINSVVEALRAAKPRRVLCLSTIGADAKHDNLLSQRGVMEEALRELQTPLTILRPACFIDNAAWDVVSARDTGLIYRLLSRQTRRSRWSRQKMLGALLLNSLVRTGLAHAQSSWKGPAE